MGLRAYLILILWGKYCQVELMDRWVSRVGEGRREAGKMKMGEGERGRGMIVCCVLCTVYCVPERVILLEG
jgi:hypothetical protein